MITDDDDAEHEVQDLCDDLEGDVGSGATARDLVACALIYPAHDRSPALGSSREDGWTTERAPAAGVDEGRISCTG